MKTRTYVMTVLALVPALAALQPTASASNEFCVEPPALVDGETTSGSVTCFALGDTITPGGSPPSARATIFWQKIGVICTYTWETVVSAGSGLWTYTQGEVEPIADQRGAVNRPGPIDSSYSGNNLAKVPVVSGMTIKVVAEITGSAGQASSTAVKVC
jgi:hypothetical protein